MAGILQTRLETFSEPVAEILRKYGEFPLPLTRKQSFDAEEYRHLSGYSVEALFPEARNGKAAVSGLLLLMGCWDESHRVAQDLASREGEYWHAIAHRIEPDSWNAGYWFRRVGEHPIFPALRQRAADILETVESKPWNIGAKWDPLLFIDWCDEARQQPGRVQEYVALLIQKAEWELLFGFCAAKAPA